MAREQSVEVVDELWAIASDVFASRLTYVETIAALAARRRAARRGRPRFAQAQRDARERWQDIRVVELDELVADVAARAAITHRLRGADAVHLASAAVLGSGVTMVSRDERLREASLAAGLDVAP